MSGRGTIGRPPRKNLKNPLIGKPPAAEWGSMMSDTRSLLTTVPWVTLAPGFAIFISVMVFNLLGDTIRDYADPKARGR